MGRAIDPAAVVVEADLLEHRADELLLALDRGLQPDEAGLGRSAPFGDGLDEGFEPVGERTEYREQLGGGGAGLEAFQQGIERLTAVRPAVALGLLQRQRDQLLEARLKAWEVRGLARRCPLVLRQAGGFGQLRHQCRGKLSRPPRSRGEVRAGWLRRSPDRRRPAGRRRRPGASRRRSRGWSSRASSAPSCAI